MPAKPSDKRLKAAKAEIASLRKQLKATQEQLQEAKKAASEWNVFIGPCAHGRDPYDRCDEDDDSEFGGCGELTAREALIRTVALEQRYACAAHIKPILRDMLSRQKASLLCLDTPLVMQSPASENERYTQIQKRLKLKK